MPNLHLCSVERVARGNAADGQPLSALMHTHLWAGLLIPPPPPAPVR